MHIGGMPLPPNLPAPPCDLPPPPNFNQEIMSEVEFIPSPGMTARQPSDPNWVPRQYLQKGNF